MVWSKVDDQLHGHPKAVVAGLEAMGLWVRALSYCGAYLTDGFVPIGVTKLIAGRRWKVLSSRLLEVGLWEPEVGGWRFHDWRTYQPSRDGIIEERKRKSLIGRAGADARWHATRMREAMPAASQAAPEAPMLPIPIPIPSHEEEDQEGECEGEPGTSSQIDPPSQRAREEARPEGLADNDSEKASKSKAKSKSHQRKTGKKTQLPDWWAPSLDLYRWASENDAVRLAPDVVDQQAAALRDWAAAGGKTYVDWDAMFRGWLRRHRQSRPNDSRCSRYAWESRKPRPPEAAESGGVGDAPAAAESPSPPDDDGWENPVGIAYLAACSKAAFDRSAPRPQRPTPEEMAEGEAIGRAAAAAARSAS